MTLAGTLALLPLTTSSSSQRLWCGDTGEVVGVGVGVGIGVGEGVGVGDGWDRKNGTKRVTTFVFGEGEV